MQIVYKVSFKKEITKQLPPPRCQGGAGKFKLLKKKKMYQLIKLITMF